MTSTFTPQPSTAAGHQPSTKSFYEGKRIFLTGHTGFKGSWLSLLLRQLGAEVTGYALAPNTRPSLYELARVGEGITSHIADIRDLPTLRAALQQAQPDIVIHMAAQPLVRESYRNPVDTYATNVMGTVHLLEGVRHTPGIRAVVNVTTDKCYENREWHWGYREDEPMGGHDPYSNSKGCAELVTAAYRNSFFTPSPLMGEGRGEGDKTPVTSSTLNPQPPSPLPAPATSSAAATGPRTASSPTSSAPSAKAGRSSFATPTPSAPGSTYWNPCPATSGSRNGSTKTDPPMPKPGTSARWTTMPARCTGSPNISPAPGVMAPAGSRTPATIRTKPPTSSSTAPRPAPAWNGALAGNSPRRSTASSPGSAPTSMATI